MSVVPDRSSSERSKSRAAPRTLLLVGLLALGIATMLFQASDLTPIPEEASTTPGFAATSRLADLVPGLTGSLKAVEGWGPSRLLSWDHDGARQLISPLPRGRADELELDAGGGLLAVTVEDVSAGVSELFVGSRSELATTGLEVTSFSWHLTQPATMAAISVGDDLESPTLITIGFDDDPLGVIESESVVPVDPRSVVLAWGPSGFLLREYDESLQSHQIVLLGPSGQRLWARPAQWAYASPDGDVLISFYNNEIRELKLVPADDAVAEGPWFELPSLGVTEIGWSADATRIAVATYRGGAARSNLDIYRNDGSLIHSVALDWHVWDVQWSPDSRFVLMPGSAGGDPALIFFDTSNETISSVPFDIAIQTAILEQ